MSYNPQPSQQRGVASDPRHGKARGEVIKGGSGASPLRQMAMVALVLLTVVVIFFLLATLLTEDANRAPWLVYGSYGVLASVALLTGYSVLRRRRNRQGLDATLRSRRSE